MKKACVLPAVLFLLSVSLFSQEGSSWELYGGYQFNRADVGRLQTFADALTNPFGFPRVDVNRNVNMRGVNFSLHRNSAGRLGAVIDISTSSGSQNIDLSRVMQALGYVPPGTSAISTFKPTLSTYSAGPQFNFHRGEKVQPFARIMAGVAYGSLQPDDNANKALGFLAPSFVTSARSVALLGGVGADYTLTTHFAIRVAADYQRTYLYGEHQNSVRISAGIVIRKYGKLLGSNKRRR
jgi:opacity protein-like surface antigen